MDCVEYDEFRFLFVCISFLEKQIILGQLSNLMHKNFRNFEICQFKRQCTLYKSDLLSSLNIFFNLNQCSKPKLLDKIPKHQAIIAMFTQNLLSKILLFRTPKNI